MFILDAETLLSLHLYAKGSEHLEVMKGAILDVIEDRTANFPDAVYKDCLNLCTADHKVWIRGAAASRDRIDIPHHRVMQVLGACPDAIDPDADEEPSQVYVVAMAYEVMSSNGSPVVVTDEANDLPDRMSLAQVCESVGIDCWPSKRFYETIDPALS